MRPVTQLMLPLILIAALAESAIGQTAFPTKPLRFVAMSTGFPENTARALANEITVVAKQNIVDRKSTRLNSSHIPLSRMPSSA